MLCRLIGLPFENQFHLAQEIMSSIFILVLFTCASAVSAAVDRCDCSGLTGDMQQRRRRKVCEEQNAFAPLSTPKDQEHQCRLHGGKWVANPLDDVQPAQRQAHAYAQGSDSHLAPGQEKHLAHDMSHVLAPGDGDTEDEEANTDVDSEDDDSGDDEAGNDGDTETADDETNSDTTATTDDDDDDDDTISRPRRNAIHAQNCKYPKMCCDHTSGKHFCSSDCSRHAQLADKDCQTADDETTSDTTAATDDDDDEDEDEDDDDDHPKAWAYRHGKSTPHVGFCEYPKMCCDHTSSISCSSDCSEARKLADKKCNPIYRKAEWEPPINNPTKEDVQENQNKDFDNLYGDERFKKSRKTSSLRKTSSFRKN